MAVAGRAVECRVRYGKVDVGYSYLYVRDPNINMTKNATTLRGSYDAGAHIVGLQYSVGF